jgi:polyisoprenoid-binding protein YceI
MKNLIFLLGACTVMALASCGGGTEANKGLDACGCAKITDAAQADFAKCIELRKDSVFEKDYQHCVIAQKNGVDPSKLNVQSSEEAKDLRAPEDGVFNFDAATSNVRWYGEKITRKKHTGTIAVKSGRIEMKGGQIVTGEVVMDMTSINCIDLQGEEKTDLEGHLKSPDFFDIAKFPEARFVITSSQSTTAIDHQTKGKLTIKGVTKDFDAKFVVVPTGSEITIGGGVMFDRAEFNVKYGSGKFFKDLGDNLINDDVTLILSLKAKR